MKKLVTLAFALSFILSSCTQNETSLRCRNFNDGWKFVRDSIVGAQAPDYDDSDWTCVTLPHDFSLLPLPGGDSEDQIGPFTKKSPDGRHTGFVLGGTGWYRKSFTLPQSDKGKRITLLFDGAYMETQVWVNGQEAGSNVHGYTPFGFDITDLLNPAGQSNVIAVKVENNPRNSRWYSGSGLYRDVRLVVTDPVHVALWGTYITTPEVNKSEAKVNVEVTVQNDDNLDAETTLKLRVLDNSGMIVTAADDVNLSLPASSTSKKKIELTITDPQLWSTDTPSLYTAEITVLRDGKAVDTYNTRFGVRSLELSSSTGLLINGEETLLKGGCVHHDNGYLGAAAIARAERRKAELLKEKGYNAVRSSHYPPSETFLNACDELGLLVIDEFTDQWNMSKNPNDYARFFEEHWEDDLTRMMLRDRNHPSVIFWSIANEVPKHNIEEGVQIGTMLRDKVKSIDDTRFVTEAVASFVLHGGWKNSYNYFDVLDVGGYNYTIDHCAEDHAQSPERVMYSSEQFPKQIYDSWTYANKYPYVIGGFVWTAFDYLGEVMVGNSTYKKEIKRSAFLDQMNDGFPVGFDLAILFKMISESSGGGDEWPYFNAWCGDYDIIGQPKPQSLYRDVVYGFSPIEVNVHEPMPEGMVEDVTRWGWQRERPIWTYDCADGEPLQVRVFTQAPSVRLELNGEVVGENSLSADDEYIAVFTVPYHEGTLTAIALNSDGSELARKELTTVGPAVGIRLTVDRNEIKACPSDLAYILIEAVDKDGNVVPHADFPVDIKVEGNGIMAASGNAAPNSMESVNRTTVKLFRGQAQAIIRPDGKAGNISVTVSSDGLDAATAGIVAR